MKKAILSRFIIVLLLAFLIDGVISYYFLGRSLFRSTTESMTDTIEVIDYALDYEGDLAAQIQELSQTAMRDDEVRITLIARDGTVVADSETADVSALDNHLAREEVAAAAEDGVGVATRYSDTLLKNMVYVAAVAGDGAYFIRLAAPYTNLLDFVRLILPVLLLGISVALVVSVLIAVRFTNTITQPLNEILTEMRKVRSDDEEFSFKEYKYEELDIISRTTEQMALEIRQRVEQLEKEKKIRQEFFSNASHELKTPITSVHGYAELLEQDMISDEALKKDIYARILRETDNMTNLINDILMISRLEAKEAEVTISTVRMVPLVTDVFESLAPIAVEYQVTLHKECRPLSIQASEQQLRELLMNLVGNGIKYNNPGGNVWVTVWTKNGRLILRVRDDGCGISREDQERVFERFYRVDKGRSRKMGGTGLGLSIVKHIVEYYNGDIELDSEPGRGSTFTVSLPYDRTGSAGPS